MIIRKLFKFEGSHIVRNCTSRRCSHSIHGHSYKVEVFIESDALDSAGMVVDFGLLLHFKEVIDMFDHTHLLWTRDYENYKDFIKQTNDRWIELTVNPSAECLALIFHYLFERILLNTRFKNNEGRVHISSVRVHETDTGYAETTLTDLNTMLHSIQPTPIACLSEELAESKGSVYTHAMEPLIDNPTPEKQI